MPAPVLVNGTPGDDILLVTAQNETLGFYQLNGAPPSPGTGFDASSFTFNGLAGNDIFRLRNPAGALFTAAPGGITFDGGGDAGDNLEVLGGSADFGTFTFTSATAGTLFHNGVGGAPNQTVNATNLSTTSLITSTVATNTFGIVGTAGTETFTVTDSGLVEGVETVQVGGSGSLDVRVTAVPVLIISGGGGNDSVDLNSANAGPSMLAIGDVGAVTQSAAVFSDSLGISATGSVTLTGSNDVDTLAAFVAGGGELRFNDIDDLVIGTAGAGVTGLGPVGASGLTAGDIFVTTQDGSLTVGNNVNGSGAVALTAGSVGASDRLLQVANGINVVGGSALTLTADGIDIVGTAVVATTGPGAIATLQPFQAGTLINVGGADAANTLGITDAEIDRVLAAVIRVGNSTAGDLTVAQAITPANSSQLELVTGGQIIDGFVGIELVTPRLGLTAATGIGVSSAVDTEVDNLEAETDTGGITIGNAGDLTIGGVNDTLTGLAVLTSGDLSLNNNGSIFLADSDGLETVRGGSVSGNVVLVATGGTSNVVATADSDAIAAAAGDITVTAGQDILLGTTASEDDNDVRASGDVIFSAGRDVTIAGFSDVASDDFGDNTGGAVTITAGRDINVSDANGDDASVGAGGTAGGDVILTTGLDATLNLTASFSSAVFSNSGDVTVNADHVSIAADSGITASNGIVTIQQRSAAWAIALGGAEAAGTLGLTDTEIDRVFTPVLRVGDGLNTGNITVVSQINAANTAVLSLGTAGAIVDGTGTEQTDITETALALRAVAGIGGADDLDVAVSTLAFNNTTGNLNITNVGALTIGAVDGLATSFNAGTTTITATSPLTFAVDTTSGASATYTAGEIDDDPVGADDLTISDDVTVSAGGVLTLQAGDDIILGAGAQATGSIQASLSAGFNDLDGLGGIASQGLVQAAALVTFAAIGDIGVGRIIVTGPSSVAGLVTTAGAIVDSNTSGPDIVSTDLSMTAATGIGTLSDPLETQVEDLEATTATGGIFIANTGDLRIGAVSLLEGVQVTTAGDINLAVTGSLLLNGTATENIRTASGNVTVNATGDVDVRNGGTGGIDSDDGDVTVTAGRDILLGSAVFDQAGEVEATGNLALNAGRDVIVDEGSFVETFDAGALSVSAGRNVSILASDGTLGASLITRGGAVTVTTGADGLLLLDSNPLMGDGTIATDHGGSFGADITLNADRLDLTAGDSVRAGSGVVTLTTATAGRAINVGSVGDAAPNTFEISDAELDRVFASSLVIGSATSGDLTVTSAITPVNAAGTLTLESGADITINANVSMEPFSSLFISAGDNFSTAAGVTVGGGLLVSISVDSDGVDPGLGGTADLRNATIAAFTTFITGAADNDTLLGSNSSFELFSGGDGDDFIDGGGASNLLNGDAGNDVLLGGADFDTINGGADDDHIEGRGGTDVLTGDGGDDTFVYRPGDGPDTITDFIAGANTDDRLDLRAFAEIRTLQDALAFATQVGSDTVFDFGGGDTLTLQDVTMTDLVLTDFVGLGARSDDFNGDRTDDILWRQDGGSVLLWEMAGGFIATASGVGFQAPSFAAVGTGDFNRDGFSDVLWRGSNGYVVTWEMQPGGGFIERGVAFRDPAVEIVETGDFNGDGTSDILWRDAGGAVSVWEMDNGQFSADVNVGGFDATWTVGGTGDFNADGTSDVLWRQDSGFVALWQMQDSAVAIESGVGVADPSWELGAVGDITGDEVSDIVWRLPGDAVVSWEMNASGAVAVERGLGFDPAADLLDVRDLTGDGTGDIVWRQDSGYVVSWEMQNGLLAVERGVGFLDSTWQIIA